MTDDLVVWEDMEALISGAMEVGFSDPEEIQMDMVRRILASEDLEGIMAPVGTTPSEDVLGLELELHDWKPMRSGVDGKPGNYLLLDVVRATGGDHELVSCGSKVVMAKVVALKVRGLLPQRVKIVRKDKATANGFYPLDLALVEAAAS